MKTGKFYKIKNRHLTIANEMFDKICVNMYPNAGRQYRWIRIDDCGICLCELVYTRHPSKVDDLHRPWCMRPQQEAEQRTPGAGRYLARVHDLGPNTSP